MTSLLDLGPMTKKVTIYGPMGPVELDVNPISADIFFDLLWRFESIKKLMEGKIADLQPADILRKLAPDALSAVLVACTGGVPEPDAHLIGIAGGDVAKARADMRARAEDIARKLGAEDQVTILTEAFRMTFKEGVGPFVNRIRKLIASVDVTTLEQATSLQGELSAALTMDVHLPKSGKPLRARYTRTSNSPKRNAAVN